VTVDPDNKHQLIVEAVLDESVGPFYIREVGILDANLDENGKGTLFAIGKYPETFKPDLPDGSGKRLYIRMIIGFASTGASRSLQLRLFVY
jgi:phage-related tail fiber protein